MRTSEIELQTYGEFRPTQFDPRGLGLDDRQGWLVVPVSRTRDSGPLEESNYACTMKALREVDPEGNDHEDHRFGHWGPGWFEVIIVRPESKAHRVAQDIAAALADYPVLDDTDLSQREEETAGAIWRDCYNTRQRIKYIRENRSQFDFRNIADMLSCVRGNYFAGYTSELID